MFFILGGCLDTPMFMQPPVHSYIPQGCTHPHMFPIPLCICMFSEAFACCGGCKGLPYVLGHLPYTTPVWGCLLFSCTPHTQLLASLCISMFWGYLYVMWAFSLLLGVWGCSPSVGDSRGTSALVMSICSFLYIFVVHYVSCFYYSYN